MDPIFFFATTSILILALLISRLTHHSGEQRLSREPIEQALYRLGEQADDAGESLTLIVVGGTAHGDATSLDSKGSTVRAACTGLQGIQ